jgi:serine/threonine protein kinase
VIVDFGFAIKLEDIDPKNKQLAYCVGTPGYIAPEMIGYRDYGTKADVFSAGATLYLMMHYSPAFFAKNKEDVIR